MRRVDRRRRPGRAHNDAERPLGAWLVGVLAAALVAWAAVEIVRPAGPANGVEAGGPVKGHADDDEPTELHRLLPDPTNDLGTRVLLDGTVVARGPRGFWVRDRRDHVVLVEGGTGAALDPGTPVRVVGVVAPGRVSGAPTISAPMVAVPEGGLLVQGVVVRVRDDGVRVLNAP